MAPKSSFGLDTTTVDEKSVFTEHVASEKVGDGGDAEKQEVISLPLHEYPWKYKAMALAAALLLSTGSHFSTNSMNSLKATIRSELHINNAQYGALQSAVSLINTILPVIGGVMMDRFGTGSGAVVFTSLIVIGNALTAIAASTSSYGLMVFARVVFGLGSGCVVVAQETLLSKWFRGKGLAIAIGLQITVSRLSNFLAQGTVINIKNDTGFYGNAFWVACGIAGGSWILSIMYLTMIRRVGNITVDTKRRFTLSTVTELPPAFWVLPLNIFLLGAVWTPFLGIATDFVQQRWGTSELISAWTSSVSLAVPVAVSPFAGLFFERYGARGPVVIFSALILVVAMALLGWASVSPMVGLVFFSISLTLAPVALTSSVALILPPDLIGTGLGIHKCCLSAGIALVDVLVGAVQDHDGGSYARVSTALLVISCASVLTSVYYWAVDFQYLKGILNAGFAKRHVLLAERTEMYAQNRVASPFSRRFAYAASSLVFIVFLLSWVVFGVYLFK